ncbi:MAG: glycosyltransferase family 4 protein [Deltaproteobacteria bacterium]|nr:glycosyltransferase family 4 protein [Deltaproteobacteria bacterium]
MVPAAYTEAEQRVLASTGRIITPSHLERRQMSDEYGVPGERVRVVPRGVESGLFPPLVRSLRGAPLLCSVGSIKRQKNTVGLVRLFAGVRARHPDARLRVIGGVQDEPYAAEVRAEIRRLDLDDCVELVGYLPPSALSGALAEAHLHLSPIGLRDLRTGHLRDARRGDPERRPRSAQRGGGVPREGPLRALRG